MLPKINAFKHIRPYVRKQELAYLARDDIVDCGKGVRTQEIKTVPLWSFHSRSIFSKDIEITKFFFIKLLC